MTSTSELFGGGAPASGGLVLLDRRVYSASTTWTKPADGAGNLLAGVGKLVVVRQQGGGGGGSAPGHGNGGAGGTSSFGSYCNATGGSGGVNGNDIPTRGGVGSKRPGEDGKVAEYYDGEWRDAVGGGLGARRAGAVRGGGGHGVKGSGGQHSGGGEGGESEDVFRIEDLTATVTVTIGAGGSPAPERENSGGPGWMIVEVWGVLS